MLVFHHSLLFSDLSHQFKVLVLIYFYFVLVALHLIEKFLGGLRGLNHCIDISLVVTYKSVVVLPQFIKVSFIHLDFGLDIMFSSFLL